MLPCEEVRQYLDKYAADTLDEGKRRAVSVHLRDCAPCRHDLEEARLVALVLREARTPPPPPGLASQIKSAALTRLRHRPPPIHQRALGSPAFLATCASLLSGAIICLMAILHVNAVQPPPDADRPAVVITHEAGGHTRIVHQPPAALGPLPTRAATETAPSRGREAVRAEAETAAAPAERHGDPPKNRGSAAALAYTARANDAHSAAPAVRMVSETALPPAGLALASQRTSLPSADGRAPASLVEAIRPTPAIEEIAPAEPQRVTTEPLAGPAAPPDPAEAAGTRP
jgi:hypothetical protein